MDYAFTDQMVREDRAELTQAALDYLKDYRGSFKPLLDARTAHLTGEVLNVAEVRMILNCMRSDTSIRMHYEAPVKSNVIEFPRATEAFPRAEPIRRKDPNFEVKIFGRIKFDMITSVHKTAQVIHDINHESVRFTYYRAGSHSYSRKMGWQQLWHDRIQVEFRHMCGSQPPPQGLLLSEAQADAWLLGKGQYFEEFGHRRYCPGCARVANG